MSTYDSSPQKGTGTRRFADEYTREAPSGLDGAPGMRDSPLLVRAGELLFDIDAEAPAVQELRDRVASLNERHAALCEHVDFQDERITAIKNLEWRIRELEADAEGNDDLRLAVHSALENLQEVDDRLNELEHDTAAADRVSELEAQLAEERERADELEARLEAIEGIFSTRVVEKEQAHTAATKRSPTDVVVLGDVYELVINEVHADGHDPKAIGRIEGLVVFVHLDDADTVPEEGDVIDVQITDTQSTCAHAMPVSEVGR